MKNFKTLLISAFVIILAVICIVPMTRVMAAPGDYYFVWRDGNNYYYHKINVNLNEEIGKNVQINPTFIPVSEIIDDRDHTTKFDIKKQGPKENHNWEICDATGFEALNLNDYANADELFEDHIHGTDINPGNVPYAANTLYHDGDHAFRVIIYNDTISDYNSLLFSTTGDTKYIPSFWDSVFYNNIYDITGSTKNNPLVILSYILEENIAITNSEAGTKFTSVKALDVPNKAVTITKVDDTFKIKFNSNAYDHVIFEIKDQRGKSYYVMIARIALHNNFTEAGVQDPTEMTFALYYPENKSYRDYEVLASIEYKNGTTDVKKLDVTDIIEKYFDDHLNKEITANRGKIWEGGLNLKRSDYLVKNIKTIDKIKFFVDYSGSTSRVFKGTFNGSNSGLTFDMKTKEFVYGEGAN